MFLHYMKILIPLIGLGTMCCGRESVGILVSELLLRRLSRPVLSEWWLFLQLRAWCVTNVHIFSRQCQRQSTKVFLIRRPLKAKVGASRKHQNTKRSLETCTPFQSLGQWDEREGKIYQERSTKNNSHPWLNLTESSNLFHKIKPNK